MSAPTYSDGILYERGCTVKITVLTENTACRSDLTAEHGLSLYIESEDHRILFDMGRTSAFAENAERLGIDLKRVDFAVISHGHYDHGGGLARFLEINPQAPVYVHREAFGAHFHGPEKYIGLDCALRHSGRLILTEDFLELAPGITLHGGCCPGEPVESWGLTRLENGQLIPEDFRHEQYLLVEEGGRRICFSGCSHRGILNITARFRPDVLIGGFHFTKLDPAGEGAAVLSRAARELLARGAVYYTGHCTGEAQYEFLKRIMGSKLCALSTGLTVEL